MDFNQIINIIALPIVIAVIGFILFKAFKPMLSGMGKYINLGWGRVKEEAGKIQTTKQNYVDYQ